MKIEFSRKKASKFNISYNIPYNISQIFHFLSFLLEQICFIYNSDSFKFFLMNQDFLIIKA